MNGLPERQKGEAYTAQIVGLVRQLVAAAEQDAGPAKRRFPRWYDLFRGALTGRFHAHKHNIHIPMMSSVVLVNTARKTQVSFGVDPAIEFLGSDEPNDRVIARKQTNLVAAQFRDMQMLSKATDFNWCADMYGRGIAQVGWGHDERDVRVVDYSTTPLSRQKVRQIIEKKIVLYDGPEFEVIDPLDFIIEPGQTDIQKAMYAGHYYTLDLEEVLDMTEGEYPAFDRLDQVRKLQQEGGGWDGPNQALKSQRGRPVIGLTPTGYESPNGLLRPVGLIDLVIRLPRELLPPNDRIAWRLITIANERYLLRNKPLPWFHQMKPYLTSAPMRDPHTFWSLGKAEMLEKIQIGANKFTNQELDAAAMRLDPAMVVSRQANLNTQNPYIRPGRVFFVDGVPQQQWMPLQLGGTPGLGVQATEMLWRWGQQGTGVIEDTAMGAGGGSSRTTAREFLGRREATDNRLDFEALSAEIDWVNPLGDMVVALNRQFMTQEREFLILGSGAARDYLTGQPIPKATRDTISPEELANTYVARARGASMRLGLANKQQNVMLLTQAMSANPATASAINWIMWSKMLAEMFELPDASELINTSEQAAAMMQQLQGPAGSAPVTNPMAGPGAGGAPDSGVDAAGGLASLINSLGGAAQAA